MTQGIQEKLAKIRAALIFDKYFDTVEKTCPKCCPDGDDPDWDSCGNKEMAECGYSDCRHPLTVINKDKVVEQALTLLTELQEELKPNVEWDDGVKAIKMGIQKARSLFAKNPSVFYGELTDDDLVAFIHDEIHKLKPNAVDANIASLYHDMRCGVVYTDRATMPIPLYERMEAVIVAEIERQKKQ